MERVRHAPVPADYPLGHSTSINGAHDGSPKARIEPGRAEVEVNRFPSQRLGMFEPSSGEAITEIHGRWDRCAVEVASFEEVEQKPDARDELDYEPLEIGVGALPLGIRLVDDLQAPAHPGEDEGTPEPTSRARRT